MIPYYITSAIGQIYKKKRTLGTNTQKNIAETGPAMFLNQVFNSFKAVNRLQYNSP